MTTRMAAFAAGLVLAGCGGHHSNDEAKVSPDDSTAMMQAVIIKVGSQPTTLIAGLPPATSTDPEKPVAKIESASDVSIAPGGVAGVELTLTPDALAAMCKVFAKIGDAASFAVADLDCPAGTAAKVSGVPVEAFISVQLPQNVGEGRFCIELSGQDDEGRVSNVVEQCVNVDEDPGSGTSNVPPVAEAGDDRSVTAGQSVVLSAAGSRDSDGSITAYHWEQVGGTPVNLQNADTPSASFTAPAGPTALTFTLTVTDDRGDQAQDSVTIDNTGAAPADPSVALGIAPGTIASGQSATLQWTSSDATSCTASGSWSGTKPTSGSEVVAPSAAGNYNYILTCDGAAGTTPATDSAPLTVTATPVPTVTISVTPSTVAPNQSATLQWSSTNATSCTASGAWSGTQPTSGTLVVSQSTPGPYDYVLTCSDGTTSATDTATLTVTASNQPTVDLTVTPTSMAAGQTATLSWTSANATACTASGDWSGSKPANGSETVTPAAGTYTYTLTCTGASGTTPASDSASLVVTSPQLSFAVIRHFDRDGDASGLGAGAMPLTGLIVGQDNALWGATCVGGDGTDSGVLFRQTLTNNYSALHSLLFATEGQCPKAPLVQGSDGNFYGVAHEGGPGGCADPGCGTVFRMTPQGVLSVLHAFDGVDGVFPTGLMQASDGNLYGTTGSGGSVGGVGSIFKIVLPAGTFSLVKAFNGADGDEPWGLIEGSDGNLYGVTRQGGAAVEQAGTVYRIAKDGTGFAILHDFVDSDGNSPVAPLLQASDGNFYGTTAKGGPGADDHGIVFKITPSGTFTPLHDFNGANGASPDGRLIEGPDGNFYGTTVFGGSAGAGTIYRITPTGVHTVLQNFTGAGGAQPHGGVTLAPDENLYGTTEVGGASGGGTIYRLSGLGFGGPAVNLTVTPSTVSPSQSATLQWTATGVASCLAGGAWSGSKPTSGSQVVTQSSPGTYVYSLTCSGANGNATDSATLTVTGGSVPTESVLHSMVDNSEGANPMAGLVQGDDGNYYGSTCAHGSGGSGDGSIVQITPAGQLTVLHAFDTATEGSCPKTELVKAPDGSFYGAAFDGGSGGCAAPGCGTVFHLDADGSNFSVVHAFSGSDGSGPTSLILANDGNLYGTTFGGGAGSGAAGTLFRIANGLHSTLHTFTGPDGDQPYGLMQASDGMLYGVTRLGGSGPDAGTIFQLDAADALAVLYNFDGTVASSPIGRLVEGTDGFLYGTATHDDGTQDSGVLFRMAKAVGNAQFIHHFEATDGDTPMGGMTFVGNVLYGTTQFGGTDGKGVVYRVNPDGTGYTVVHNFHGATADGNEPLAPLLLGSDGDLYGTTSLGGNGNVGTVFTISNP